LSLGWLRKGSDESEGRSHDDRRRVPEHIHSLPWMAFSPWLMFF
jgi:hypothetical protein